MHPDSVPLFVLRVPVRYYRQPPPFFQGWRADAAPRWGERFGRGWQQEHNNWERWDRRSAPAAAPLPTYQRNFRGEQYPRAAEHQQALREQNYRYPGRDGAPPPRAPPQAQPQAHQPPQPQPQPHQQPRQQQPQQQQPHVVPPQPPRAQPQAQPPAPDRGPHRDSPANNPAPGRGQDRGPDKGPERGGPPDRGGPPGRGERPDKEPR
jgi:hypothetical protein